MNKQTHSTDAGKGSNLKYRQNNKKLLHWIDRFLDVPVAKAACFELDNSRLRSLSSLPATKKFSFTHSTSHAQTRTILYRRISPSPPFQQSVRWSAASTPNQLPSGSEHQECGYPRPWYAPLGFRIHIWQPPTPAPWGNPAGMSCVSYQCSTLSQRFRCHIGSQFATHATAFPTP